MKIRRKVSKAAKPSLPLFVVGFSAPPALETLQQWFDAEYGGPLTIKHLSEQALPSMVVTHGPWSVAIEPRVEDTRATVWREQLQWSHETCACIGRPAHTPASAADQVLHATRLARGFTLLTHGTAYDIEAGQYSNPSEWLDRRLVHFDIHDHVRVEQGESPEGDRTWWLTRGLRKFGVDDLETFQALGLPDRGMETTLLAVAEELLHVGRAPTVGTTLDVAGLDHPIRVVRHRTVPMPPVTVVLREITW